MKGFKERFEKGESEVEVQKTTVDIDVQQIGNIKAAFEKVCGEIGQQKLYF